MRILTDYVYDNERNLFREEIEEKLIHVYEYGAMNRLSKAWNGKGQESVYLYNGLGQRTGKSTNREEKGYLLDLTRGYHNLLDIYKDEGKQRFYFDGNVAAMEETSGRTSGLRGKSPSGRTAFPGLHYYMQDELGSPLRVSGFRAKEGSFIGRSEYLTYGYDEFGNDLGDDLRRELEGAGIPDPYDRQGAEQPFGYTGYRYDDISETYFAQAREYQPENGRFTAEDVIKGNGAFPLTLNGYGYCWNNPMIFIDVDGKYPNILVYRGDIPEYILVAMEQGDEAHRKLRGHMASYPNLESEKYIPGGLEKENEYGYYTPTGTGFADFVYFNPTTGNAEV